MTTQPRTLIRMTGVRKVFTTEEVETHALEDVNLRVAEGEFVAVAGPSGCGKSTLLSLLGLLDTPSGGHYELNGTDTGTLSFARRAALRNRCIGFVFQSFNLIGELSVYENVELPLLYGNVPQRRRSEAVRSVLEKVGMEHRLNHAPAQLSGGQQQRVAVARALVAGPLVLLADEPTGNLDSRNGEVVMDLMAQLHQEGTTVMMVTHDPRYLSYAQRTVHLFDGRVVDETAVEPGVAARAS